MSPAMRKKFMNIAAEEGRCEALVPWLAAFWWRPVKALRSGGARRRAGGERAASGAKLGGSEARWSRGGRKVRSSARPARWRRAELGHSTHLFLLPRHRQRDLRRPTARAAAPMDEKPTNSRYAFCLPPKLFDKSKSCFCTTTWKSRMTLCTRVPCVGKTINFWRRFVTARYLR